MPLTPIRRFENRCVAPIHGSADGSAKEMAIILPASVSYPMGTLLGQIIGTSQVDTLTIGGGATGGTFALIIGGVSTANITYSSGLTAATVQAALDLISPLADNAVQTLTEITTPTGGFFQLGFRGKLTSQLAYNATAAQVQAALVDICGAGNVTVAGGALPGTPVTITFGGFLGGVRIPLLEVSNSNIVPVGDGFTSAIVTNGGGGTANVAVTGSNGGPYTITFQGSLESTPVTLTTGGAGSLTGGSPTIAVAQVTAGVAALNTFKKQDTSATDGSAVPRAILKYDISTDSAGNHYFGQQTAGEHQEAYTDCPAWFRGDFSTKDLVDLTDANAAQLGKIISGNLAAGGILRVT